VECVTANLHVLHKLNPAAYSCWLHRNLTVLRFAPSRFDVVYLFTGINHREWPPKCLVWGIETVHSLTERTSADLCLELFYGTFMKQTLNDGWLALLFPIQWRSKHRFCVVQVDDADHPRHKRGRLPPCHPYLATSNISSINKVNTEYNGQCSEKELFAIASRHIWQIDKVHHTTTSSCEWRQQGLQRRQGPRSWSVAQLAIQNQAWGGETTRNTLFKQRRQGEIDRALCGKRDRCGRNASWRRRDSD